MDGNGDAQACPSGRDEDVISINCSDDDLDSDDSSGTCPRNKFTLEREIKQEKIDSYPDYPVLTTLLPLPPHLSSLRKDPPPERPSPAAATSDHDNPKGHQAKGETKVIQPTRVDGGSACGRAGTGREESKPKGHPEMEGTKRDTGGGEGAAGGKKADAGGSKVNTKGGGRSSTKRSAAKKKGEAQKKRRDKNRSLDVCQRGRAVPGRNSYTPRRRGMADGWWRRQGRRMRLSFGEKPITKSREDAEVKRLWERMKLIQEQNSELKNLVETLYSKVGERENYEQRLYALTQRKLQEASRQIGQIQRNHLQVLYNQGQPRPLLDLPVARSSNHQKMPPLLQLGHGGRQVVERNQVNRQAERRFVDREDREQTRRAADFERNLMPPSNDPKTLHPGHGGREIVGRYQDNRLPERRFMEGSGNDQGAPDFQTHLMLEGGVVRRQVLHEGTLLSNQPLIQEGADVTNQQFDLERNSLREVRRQHLMQTDGVQRHQLTVSEQLQRDQRRYALLSRAMDCQEVADLERYKNLRRLSADGVNFQQPTSNTIRPGHQRQCISLHPVDGAAIGKRTENILRHQGQQPLHSRDLAAATSLQGDCRLYLLQSPPIDQWGNSARRESRHSRPAQQEYGASPIVESVDLHGYTGLREKEEFADQVWDIGERPSLLEGVAQPRRLVRPRSDGPTYDDVQWGRGGPTGTARGYRRMVPTGPRGVFHQMVIRPVDTRNVLIGGAGKSYESERGSGEVAHSQETPAYPFDNGDYQGLVYGVEGFRLNHQQFF